MTTTKQRLENKLKRELQFITSGIQKAPQMDGGEMTKNIHIANLLAPLLLEIVEALKLHDSACRGSNIDVKNLKKNNRTRD